LFNYLHLLATSFRLDDFNIVFRQQKKQPDFIFGSIINVGVVNKTTSTFLLFLKK